ncbi:hypothetical protein U4E84_01710 [Halorubrum sp. AD140]|uniref:hypothetical protein n=1 Tax=Halorubrum sp. AD140 TaxID=3050073 RepID=UPI002ACD0F6B|nr:hypothetical protein [Halorubrum sp. AD140]MDZ5810071.1 hypothetical protein [Halorubrum sp. AD140]
MNPKKTYDWAVGPEDKEAEEFEELRQNLKEELEYTKDEESWSEIAYDDVLWKQKVTGDTVISIHAQKESHSYPHEFPENSKDIEGPTITTILKELKDRDGPAFTTEEIASWFSASKELIAYRLAELKQRGEVDNRKSGEVFMWWTEEDKERENDLLSGFGALADTEIPEKMKEERQNLREEWDDEEILPR